MVQYQKKRIGDFDGRIVLEKRTNEKLEWKPKVNFEEGVRRYIEWYKQKR